MQGDRDGLRYGYVVESHCGVGVCGGVVVVVVECGWKEEIMRGKDCRWDDGGPRPAPVNCAYRRFLSDGIGRLNGIN